MGQNTKRNEIQSERERRLIEGIVEIIAIYPGLSQNKLKKRVVDDEKLAAKSTFEDRLKTLTDDGIIEGKKGVSQEINYYIVGQTDEHRKIYGDKLTKDIFKLNDQIKEITRYSQNFDEDTFLHALDAISRIQDECNRVLCTYQRQNTMIYSIEDGVYEEIKEFTAGFPHEEIVRQLHEASVIHDQIKKTNDERSVIICNIINKKSTPIRRTKSVNKLIENRRTFKKYLKDLNDICGNLHERRNTLQEKVFLETLDELDKELESKIPYPKIKIIRQLSKTLQNLTIRENNLLESFKTIINSCEDPLKESLMKKLESILERRKVEPDSAKIQLRESLISLRQEIEKPVNEKVLVKKLTATKFFTKNSAYEFLRKMEWEGQILRSEKGIYRYGKYGI